ncbi:MAG: glycosyl transferase [Clostridia bacterium]|nr:glycosyl transferase [Clostridia bacterium]
MIYGLSWRGMLDWMSDEAHFKLFYREYMGKRLKLDPPRSFNEKIVWLSLHDRRPEYTIMVDKHKAKEYVGNIIGHEHIIPTLAVYDSVNDIDFDALPDQFVLKTNHDSQGLVICRDKAKLDRKTAIEKLNNAIQRDFYKSTREWPYKDVERKIIAEKYMDDGSGGLRDYKIFCFNNEPKFLYISEGLEDHSTAKMGFFTFDGEQLPFYRADYNRFEQAPPMPEGLEEMIAISDKLAKKINRPFVRLDFYSVKGTIYFGEITLCPACGKNKIEPEEWLYTLGEWITLPENMEEK